MRSKAKPGLTFEGTLIGGPEIDLVKTSGLSLSEAQLEKLWSCTDALHLVRECASCNEIEVERIEGGPGRSDSIYRYICDDKHRFIAELRAAILKAIKGA